MLSLFIAAGLLGLACSQQVGKEQTETHPKFSWSKCTSGGSCTSTNAEVVIDANWRWLHGTSDTKNCYDGNAWTSVCSTATDCASKCALEGADYSKTYGASTSGNALTLKFVTKHEYGTNIGSRFYLMNGESKYQVSSSLLESTIPSSTSTKFDGKNTKKCYLNVTAGANPNV